MSSSAEGGQREDRTSGVFSHQRQFQPHVLPVLRQESPGICTEPTLSMLSLSSVLTVVPSLSQVNYTQPLVAVKFLNASLNTDIDVECKVISNTLIAGSERDKFAGRVSFKLRINDK